ncbi:MAG: TIGR02710 family CRISPR-associated CARF protein [Methanobrevibacter woesei]|uniref:TIGR02710 family CRISPR-associated CARF protein n=1 Tax=Methanobrevibacter woesei TaxID=190976 RepID=UPI0023F11772|nr:TIGR02710 family CRISPR-associated CARF protein [Methanobrevibacter woesei]MCI7291887.1 TIGR02710 family CRISPR-associated CARF protein [Methanobrevibacter woesei]
MQKALVLSVGGSSEPLIYSIKTYKPDFIYFLHSKDTREHVDITLKEFDYDSSQYLLKELNNPQSLEESFSKSREIISSLKKDFDVHVDFTGGTKPMVAGLVLAAIGEECKYSYVGSKGREGRDKDGVGVVVSGFEEIISQKDPYDLYAVVEFNRGMDFFNKYQFTAAKSNFSAASEKLEDENLKELANLYVDLVGLYDVWDKFNNKINKKTLNSYLENQILKKINDSENIRNTLEDESPGFLSQIEANIEFLKLKISRKGVIEIDDVKYYLPDLLNNASRRIEECKYDDAVARLYRATELIAQTGLANEGFININRLRENKIFRIPLDAIENCDNKNAVEYIKGLDEYWYAKKGVMKIPLAKSFDFLKHLGCQYANDYLEDKRLKSMVNKRNDSLLAHGLNPINREDAENLFESVLKYSIGVFPEIEKYMEMAKFPKFKE